ncbi:hypothetical protein CDAR_189631 [Caerostris darwini]|uniref:Uncharacterized protein n=1 Tax=Caerostris darwini TaxID=1538125 RepID=A0AAV4QS88_9ARAC|nr:hypothetical protein CDAR_189631 [Caerostris darwini]
MSSFLTLLSFAFFHQPANSFDFPQVRAECMKKKKNNKALSPPETNDKQEFLDVSVSDIMMNDPLRCLPGHLDPNPLTGQNALRKPFSFLPSVSPGC